MADFYTPSKHKQARINKRFPPYYRRVKHYEFHSDVFVDSHRSYLAAQQKRKKQMRLIRYRHKWYTGQYRRDSDLPF